MTAPAPTETKTPTWTGQSLPRKEDERLLKAQGAFVDDEGMYRMGYAHFVRSPHAHAEIVSVDVSKADAMSGVITTLTGDEVKAMTEPLFQFAPKPEGQIDEYLLGALARRSSDGLAEDLEWVHSLFPIVAEFKKRQAGYLSGGQQQQLALARALVSRPDLLLLDEPTLGLAPSVVSVLFDALAEIRESGVPILLVEQRAQQAVGFADRTHVMRDGRLTLSLSPEDAGDTEGLTAAYFG